MFLIPNIAGENVEYSCSCRYVFFQCLCWNVARSCCFVTLDLSMAMLISSIIGGPTLIGRSVGAAWILGGFSGADRFKSSLKCSTHLFRCSSMLVITLPSLLFTGRSGLQWFSESLFVVSHNCLMFPSLAAIFFFMTAV
ncbi:unnamed protein product [Schistosoma margrebowiei]|uniref:Uncharacterized protein n=1 Tax=Schistosoma margrebowiei TaxID=48269 RepID=A0A3P8DDF0_9TREM|nr:unnamed protein product [Schistosoma margrebowiei]